MRVCPGQSVRASNFSWRNLAILRGHMSRSISLNGALHRKMRHFRSADATKPMTRTDVHCVLLAQAYHGLSEGVRGLLATTFKAVVMVADEVSLFESAGRLQSDLAVVDLT